MGGSDGHLTLGPPIQYTQIIAKDSGCPMAVGLNLPPRQHSEVMSDE